MKDDSLRIDDLLATIERLLSISGIWPLERSCFKYGLFMTYMLGQIILLLVDFFNVLGNLELVIMNLTETVLLVITFPMMLVIRFSGLLVSVIAAAKEDITDDNFSCLDERRCYATYNRTSKIFFRAGMTFTTITVTLMYMKPLIHFLGGNAEQPDNSTIFVTPFRTYIFFDITSTQVYALVYACQFPMIYLTLCHFISISLLMSLVMHVCGRLAILAYRIQRLSILSGENVRGTIRDLVETHLKLIWMGKSIDKVFHLVLLLELTGNSVRLGLSSYYTLVNSDVSDATALLTFITYTSIMFVILYGYCFMGEQLIQECRNVSNAYYLCDWYEIPLDARKLLVICMVYGQKSIHLTAGKFYVFSVAGFTDIIKTSMAYLSMLRTVM